MSQTWNLKSPVFGMPVFPRKVGPQRRIPWSGCLGKSKCVTSHKSHASKSLSIPLYIIYLYHITGSQWYNIFEKIHIYHQIPTECSETRSRKCISWRKGEVHQVANIQHEPWYMFISWYLIRFRPSQRQVQTKNIICKYHGRNSEHWEWPWASSIKLYKSVMCSLS